MTSAPDRRTVARAVTFGLRAVVSALAAFTFASAIVMFMFARDIGVQVAKTSRPTLPATTARVILPRERRRWAEDWIKVRALWPDAAILSNPMNEDAHRDDKSTACERRLTCPR